MFHALTKQSRYATAPWLNYLSIDQAFSKPFRKQRERFQASGNIKIVDSRPGRGRVRDNVLCSVGSAWVAVTGAATVVWIGMRRGKYGQRERSEIPSTSMAVHIVSVAKCIELSTCWRI